MAEARLSCGAGTVVAQAAHASAAAAMSESFMRA
jgi:hypothetical protein